MKKNRKSNYSLVLLCVLLFDFINFYLRTNEIIGEPLGMNLKRISYVFLILNFIYAFAIYLIKNMGISKTALFNLAFLFFMLVMYLKRESAIELSDIMNLTSWFIIPFLFYYYGFPKSKRALNIIMVSFVILFVFMYYRFGILSNIRSAGLTNAIYFLIMSIPFIMFMENRLLKLVFYVAITTLTILSLKIVPLIMLFAALTISFVFKKNSTRTSLLKRFFVSCVALFVVGVLFFVVSYLAGIDIVGNISMDIDNEGNGRFDIWRNIIAVFQKAPVNEQVFGLGFEKSEELFGISAHSDFMEVLFSFGYVGLAFFVISFLFVAKKLILQAARRDSRYLGIVLAICAQVFIIFAFSNSFFVSNYLLLSLVMVGFLLNHYDEKHIYRHTHHYDEY